MKSHATVSCTPACTAGLRGAVLAGGLSSRLGLDKAGLRLTEEGPDLLARAALLLRSLGLPPLVVGRQHTDFDWIYDATPGQGPLGGIVAALRHAQGPCLVISCDLPFMDAPTLLRLLAARETRPPAALYTAFWQPETGHTEHLAAIYEYAALDPLEQGLGRGLLKISRILPAESRHGVPYSPQGSLPFFNINYPADLLLAKDYLRLKTKEDKAP
ncbi:MAG: molybdenum cofactor guanylyltransferase [Deltaproteobacteria bacterium]|jgi:molybdopterin-guanine dinucleotide biosynthesis protein A|nr:molybdenum cofactor guanylyltransferase [Deltaproteobacteria bacterium]